MRVYRNYLVGTKRKLGSARGLMHFKQLLNEYIEAKRDFLAGLGEPMDKAVLAFLRQRRA